jgi:hypothetical protein
VVKGELKDEPPAGRSAPAQSWLSAETLESLTELNEQCLELLRVEAATATAASPPLLVELREAWAQLDTEARRRAAACPFLLVDVCFADARLWALGRGHQIHDMERTGPERFFTAPHAAQVMRLVLTYAWHLARSRSPASRVMLGMSYQAAELVAACTLKQVTDIAERHPEWLQPRWPGRLQVWRTLLSTAIAGDAAAIERAGMHGLQILAAELRSAGGT